MREFKIREIVLVDDDLIVKLIVQKISRKLGFTGTITTFSDGLEAIESIKNQVATNSFEILPERILLLLDINMPIMDAWGFLDEFSMLPDEVKNQFIISIITSSVSDQDNFRAFSYQNVEDFMQKPLSEDFLYSFFTRHGLCEEILTSE